MTDTFFDDFSVDDGAVRADLLVQPAINYALLHNRVPAVRHLSLSNLTDEPVTDLVVRLELHGPDGPLATPWATMLATPLQAGGSVAWEDFSAFIPDATLLRATNEAFPVDYRVTVSRPERSDLTLIAPSLVLAHDEWFNSPALYDSLAAFVQPNSAAVEAVLRSAGQLLLARTGSGSLQGYQDGPARGAQIAGAVYEALRQVGIHYRALPASFERTGQKVRTTGAVLAGRLGNCVDLSVTYAACLEAAGLRPLIWLTRGHAFAGFLLEEERLSASVVTEANLLASMVESGRAVPVELTRIGPGAASADFSAAVRAGIEQFRGGLGDLLGVVDVYLAHRSGIRPLPSVDAAAAEAASAVDAQPVTGSIELPAGVAQARLRQQAQEADEAPEQRDSSPARVRRWKKSLLDLSLRNPLLNLPKRGRGIDLHVPAGALALLDDLVHAGKRVEVIAQDAISQVHQLAGVQRAQELDPAVLTEELRKDRRIYGAVTEARYKNAMRAVQREARTMEQETGSNYLYLTIGTLVHPKSTGGEAQAPLFLLPVRVEGGTGRRPYSIVVDGTETATPNHCLIEWLRVKHQVRIPELENPARDDAGIDVPKTLAAISDRLVENRLNYRIDETASLRLLQFATFQMWRDLTDHWPTFKQNPVVRHLVESTGATFDDPAVGDAADDALAPAVDEANLHLPIPADGSQMRAIVMAERGRSFVLEGPPGTGKSQTITNLIARAVTAGRTVLFVAEKQAALDVVKRRLRQVGLDPFTLDLHGRKQSINAIREQLREALEQEERADDVAWTAAETAYRTRLTPLSGYPPRLHTANSAGLSLWSSYEAKLAYGEGQTADVPVSYLAATSTAAEDALRDFPAAARSARLRLAHPWSISGRRDLTGLHPAAVADIAEQLEQARTALAADPALTELVRQLPAPGDLRDVLEAARLAVLDELPDRAATQHASDPRWAAAVANLQAELGRFRQLFAPELSTFRPEILTVPELTTWHTGAQEAGKRLFGKRKARQAVADRLVPYLLPEATLDAEQVEAVVGRLVAARAQASAAHQQAHAIGGLRLPPGWLPTSPQAEQQLAAARHATEVSRALLDARPGVWTELDRGVSPVQLRLLNSLAAAWRAWLGVLATGPAELTLWQGTRHWTEAWQRDGATWLADVRSDQLLALQRWAAVLRPTDVLDHAGLAAFRRQLLVVDIDADHAEEAYQRGVAATSLAERMRAGDLEYFDGDVHDDHIAQFEAAAAHLRGALPERLPTVLVRRRPFNPGERRGRFADFAAEIRRKRGGRSFRELFAAYPDVVLALTPCVLVSPASAATFLAPDAARFDLVIFDEASQIRVAEAIGTMGRGAATVIVGDSRQMPPTAVMQASHNVDEPDAWDGPEDGAGGATPMVVPEDLDSILSEAVESGLPQQWLSWHYRSHDESLIAFSNHYYYENKLSSLPSPGRAGVGVGWQRVDGVFDRGGSRTNEVEARAIVADIARRLRDPATAGQSIGVVTFNIQQRDLVLNLLEDSDDPVIRDHLIAAGAEPIFVKNLENVQGDERDVVLFSLAFSVNPETGQLPLNFGPLSQAGGERRLNVAITRARRQVLLFASFDPKDIDLTRTSAVGTQHLRAYCEMAAAGMDRLGDLADDRVHRRDPVRDQVASAIRARGYEVATCHGLSDFTVDIAVRAPGEPRWQVAVMLDGPLWGTRPTVADRDLAPALLRHIMGWPEVIRCWLPSWIRDEGALLDRVSEAVARAQRQPGEPEQVPEPAQVPDSEQVAEPAQVPEPEQLAEPAQLPAISRTPVPAITAISSVRAVADDVSLADVAGGEALDGRRLGGGGTDLSTPVPFVPYRPTSLGVQSDIDAIDRSTWVNSTVREALAEVITAEGPIEQHRLARLVLARFGFAKAHEDRRAAVLSLVDRALVHEHPAIGTFIWPPGVDPYRWRGIRTNQASNDRAFAELAPEEIANAVAHSLANAATHSLDEEELLRSAMSTLGFRRKTDNIDRLLRYGLQLALTAGRAVRRTDGRYQAT